MDIHKEIIEDLTYFARAGELDDLKKAKASPEYFVEKDENGKTALHMASANNHVDIVNYIIQQLSTLGDEKRIELINTKNEQGNTALHWAALNGHLEMVKILVKSGGDCKIKNEMKVSPIYEAHQRDYEEISNFFLQTMTDEMAEEPLAEDEQFVETGVPQKNQEDEQ